MGLFDLFSDKPPSQEKFGKIAIDFASKAGLGTAMRFDPEEFRILIGENGERIFNLHNVYRDYCAAKKNERTNVLSKYFSAMTEQQPIPTSFTEAKAQLIPIIRGRGLAEQLRLLRIHEFDDESGGIAAAPFSDDALIMLAYDTEFATQTLTTPILRDWGVTFQDALQAGMDNLRDATVSRFEEYRPGLFVSTWGDAYDSSRILLSDLIYRLEVGGEPIAMIPTRGRILVASSSNKTALLEMLDVAKKVATEEGRMVSALMYRFENGKAIEYQPTDGEIQLKLADLKKQYLIEDYGTQKHMLEKIHSKNNVDIFVASYQAIQQQDTGQLHSYCVWTKGVNSLLPETDLVALVINPEGSGEPASKVIKWSELTKVVKDLMEPQHDGYPVRYKVVDFPEQRHLEQLWALEDPFTTGGNA